MQLIIRGLIALVCVGAVLTGPAHAAGSADGAMVRDLVEHIAGSVADTPGQFTVAVTETDSVIALVLAARTMDSAAVHGMNQQAASAISAVLDCVAKKLGRRIDLVMTPPPAAVNQAAPRLRSSAARSSGGDREDNTIYVVVVNHEEQYSIWPEGRELPLGWSDAGKHGTKRECLDYIEVIWTDMRPLSLRKKMEEAERERQAAGGN